MIFGASRLFDRKEAGMKAKILIVTVTVMLVIACSVGSTLAWLTDKTETLKNVFTAGDISIELKESDDLDLKMVPGKAITKNPYVTVKKGSEECWLFVKIDKSDNFDSFLSFEVAGGWTKLDGTDNIYYRNVDAATTSDLRYQIIKNNTVYVKTTVTKEDLKGTMPTLSFTAYAIQSSNLNLSGTTEEQAKKAWEMIGTHRQIPEIPEIPAVRAAPVAPAAD